MKSQNQKETRAHIQYESKCDDFLTHASFNEQVLIDSRC